MKLLFCLKCNDVIKLGYSRKVCECGSTSGYYEGNGLHAKYEGAHAIPLGVQNASLMRAVNNQPADGMGERFEAFVIPSNCETFVRESSQRRISDVMSRVGEDPEEVLAALRSANPPKRFLKPNGE